MSILFKKNNSFFVPFLMTSAILLFLCFGACQFITFKLFEPKDTIVKEAVSPDGKVRALVIERNCGATTDYAYWVKVVPADFSLKWDHGDANRTPPAVLWLGTHSISITVPDPDNFAGVETECKDVTYSLSR